MTVKILIVHSVYQNFHLSGENNVVETQVDFLKTLKGVEVRVINQKSVSNHSTFYGKVKSALRVASGFGEDPLRKSKGFNPDLVIVHNLFPSFGTRWLRKIDVPTIMYIHNYRNFCASGNFFRNSENCRLCITKSPVQAMKFSCYKGSKIATLPVFLKQIREKSRGPQVSSLVRYICVSEPIFSAYLKSGIPADKVSVVPNFVVSHELSNSQIAFRTAATNWVVVGRLVEEKGFGKLIENWPDEFNLDIIGEGPERSKLEALSLGRSNIRMLGALSKSEVSEALQTYSGAFVPSIWSEGSPLTEIEFYRAGLPVIQIQRPGRQFYEVSELTIPYEDFMTVQAKPLLINAMSYVLANHPKLSNQSKLRFAAEYSSEAWLKRINGCLQDWFGFRVD